MKNFEQLQEADAYVSKENNATTAVIPIMEGDIAGQKCVEGDILFSNLSPWQLCYHRPSRTAAVERVQSSSADEFATIPVT